MRILLLLAAVLFLIAAFGELNPPVVWQYDEVRARIAEVEAQHRLSDEFNRTNTNPFMSANYRATHISWNPHKGDRELGYRSDHVVIWRFVPEAELDDIASKVKHIDGPNTGHYDPTNMMYLKTDPEGAQPVDMNHATTNQ